MSEYTKVNCCCTECKYNSACCICPATNIETYCTLKKIDLIIDEEIGIMECSQYDRTEKPYECIDCQIEKYGDVELEPDIEFIEVDDIEDLFK